ncbi:MAG: GNAT family protein [Kineosporiaceae bacterium]
MPEVTLRPFRDGEEAPPTPSRFSDWGADRVAPVRFVGELAVVADGVVVGDVAWHEEWYGPTAGSLALNIGIDLVLEARGRGIGTRAQRLLVEHLFATTTVTRIEASTDVENLAEQRALERAGFTREGVLRGAQERADGRHDLVLYAVLRGDLPRA